jgi:CheY-like chemotaxis protein
MRILTGIVDAGAIRIDDVGGLPEGARVTVIVEDDDEDQDDEVPPLDVAVRDMHVTVEEIPILPEPAPAPEPTVLIVEDDPDLSEVFCDVLEAAGYRVVTARDGSEALRYLKGSQTRPHLILLDVRMPNMDGVQFRKEQAAIADVAGIPVVVTSADGNVQQAVDEMKAQAFLPKPVRRSELVATVSRLCDDDADD